jgi:serine protease Do
MNVTRWAALAGGLVLAGAIVPSAVVHGQSNARTIQVFGGARIGVTVNDVEAEDARQGKSGVIVETVSPDSPAEKAGIKAGDAIVEFDGERVRSVRQFTRLVQESAPDRSVAAVLTRGGSRVTVNVTPDRSAWSDEFGFRLLDRARSIQPTPLPPTPPAARTPRPFFDNEFPTVLRLLGGRRLGATMESLDDQLAEYFGVKEGALVKSVMEGSVAQKAGLKAGDVIAAIDGRKVYEASDVNRALDRVAESGEFTMEIVRDKKTQTLKGKLEPRETRTRARGVRTIL